jgi:hypothetical protein
MEATKMSKTQIALRIFAGTILIQPVAWLLEGGIVIHFPFEKLFAVVTILPSGLYLVHSIFNEASERKASELAEQRVEKTAQRTAEIMFMKQNEKNDKIAASNGTDGKDSSIAK